MTKVVTVPSLAAQTRKDFGLVVRMDPGDVFYPERVDAFASVGVPLTIIHSPGGKVDIRDYCNLDGEWPKPELQTRMDDDDAISLDFVERLQERAKEPGVYSFPHGLVHNGGRIAARMYPDNQFLSYIGPDNIYSTDHNRFFRDRLPQHVVDRDLAWMWVLHRHSQSVIGGRQYPTRAAISPRIRKLFPIEWEQLERLQNSPRHGR
jgi:hypothetical protein